MIRIYIFIIFATSICVCQEKSKYPFRIVGDGETEFIFPAGQDTFWVFKHNQYLNALHKVDSLRIVQEQLSLINKKFELQNEIVKLQMSITDTVKFGYNHYKNLWIETDRKLEEAEIKASQRWTYFNGGILAGIIAAILIHNYL